MEFIKNFNNYCVRQFTNSDEKIILTTERKAQTLQNIEKFKFYITNCDIQQKFQASENQIKSDVDSINQKDNDIHDDIPKKVTEQKIRKQRKQTEYKIYKKFDDETKKSIVSQIMNDRISIQEAAKEHNTSVNNIKNWENKLKSNGNFNYQKGGRKPQYLDIEFGLCDFIINKICDSLKCPARRQQEDYIKNNYSNLITKTNFKVSKGWVDKANKRQQLKERSQLAKLAVFSINEQLYENKYYLLRSKFEFSMLIKDKTLQQQQLREFFTQDLQTILKIIKNNKIIPQDDKFYNWILQESDIYTQCSKQDEYKQQQEEKILKQLQEGKNMETNKNDEENEDNDWKQYQKVKEKINKLLAQRIEEEDEEEQKLDIEQIQPVQDLIQNSNIIETTDPQTGQLDENHTFNVLQVDESQQSYQEYSSQSADQCCNLQYQSPVQQSQSIENYRNPDIAEQYEYLQEEKLIFFDSEF